MYAGRHLHVTLASKVRPGNGLVSAKDSTPTYLLHGLRVSSKLRLDAPTVDSPAHDLTISIGVRRVIPDAVPGPQLLARLDLPGGSSSLAAANGGFVLRIHGQCDFEIASQLDRVEVHESPDAHSEFATLMGGTLLATVLTLNGASVLHASAVEASGVAIAFVAGAGMGKTTVAALACAAGARLVTDDVLRVESAEGRGWCFSGSRELRLRAGSAALANALSQAAPRSTLDKRYAVRPAATASARLPIGAIVAPSFGSGEERLRVERIRGRQAVQELVRFPRTLGWTDGEVTRRDFGVLAALAQQVPVYRATLPQQLEPEVAKALLSAVDCPPGS
jgi:hypothetical protein